MATVLEQMRSAAITSTRVATSTKPLAGPQDTTRIVLVSLRPPHRSLLP